MASRLEPLLKSTMMYDKYRLPPGPQDDAAGSNMFGYPRPPTRLTCPFQMVPQFSTSPTLIGENSQVPIKNVSNGGAVCLLAIHLASHTACKTPSPGHKT
jgi:hypothetical protein